MRQIDADELIRRAIERYKEMMGTDIGHGMGIIVSMITDARTIDAVPLDDVAKMIDDAFGCPCDYSPTDEWLPEVCELQDVCPHPEDSADCWKQYIKHYGERKEHG